MRSSRTIATRPRLKLLPIPLVAARMLEHKAASVRSLAEVQDVIKQKLLNKKALDMAVKQGKSAARSIAAG